MTLTKEFPLRDISMNQYVLGSAAGIIFTWAAMILSFLWQNSLIGERSKVSRMATAFLSCANQYGLYLHTPFSS